MINELLWPERQPVRGPEIDAATRRIADAQAAGKITAEQAEGRQAQVAAAGNRGELYAAVTALGPLPPLALPRVAAGLWGALGAVQLTVWLLICLISWSLDGPWFLWSLAGGALVVLGISRGVEWAHRHLLGGGSHAFEGGSRADA
jgi:hypothetical protein